MTKNAAFPLLRCFVRVIERGSISAAARDLGMTQPTVSRQLRDLENAYGAVLAIRTTRALRLTEAGRLVYTQARLTLQADEVLRERLQLDAREVKGRIQIAAASAFGTLVLTAYCSRFARRYPDVTIDLRLTDRDVDLVGEGMDLAVRIGKLSDSSLFAKPLAMLEEVIVCHPSIVQAVGRPKDLSKLPWTVFSGLKESFAIRLKRRGRTEQVKVRPRMFTDQILAHRQALLAGAGAGLIHRYAVDADLQQGHLVRLLPDWELPAWPTHALFTVRTPARRMRIWFDELRGELAEVPGLTVAKGRADLE